MEMKTEAKKNVESKFTEQRFDYNKFERNIPQNMRYKECGVEGDVLYWVTQEPFDKFDLSHFIDALEDTFLTKAYVIVRDDSTYSLKRDIANGYGVMIDLTQNEYIIPGKNIDKSWIDFTENVNADSQHEAIELNYDKIEIKEEIKVPGTNVILEAGDKVKLVNKKTEATESEIIFEDSNFVFRKIMMLAADDDSMNFNKKVAGWTIDTKPHSKADEYVISLYIDCDWRHLDVADAVQVKYGMRMGGKPSITEFIKTLQDSLKFAEKVASYLKVKVANK